MFCQFPIIHMADDAEMVLVEDRGGNGSFFPPHSRPRVALRHLWTRSGNPSAGLKMGLAAKP